MVFETRSLISVVEGARCHHNVYLGLSLLAISVTITNRCTLWSSAVLSWRGGQSKLLQNTVYDDDNNDGIMTQISRFASRLARLEAIFVRRQDKRLFSPFPNF